VYYIKGFYRCAELSNLESMRAAVVRCFPYPEALPVRDSAIRMQFVCEYCYIIITMSRYMLGVGLYFVRITHLRFDEKHATPDLTNPWQGSTKTPASVLTVHAAYCPIQLAWEGGHVICT
jgi:hypothetical protein